MPQREILQHPDPQLYKKSEKINKIDQSILDLASEMEEYIMQQKALGLAAIQLGEPVCIIAIRRSPFARDPKLIEPVTIINPVITRRSPQMFLSQEGCFSISHGTSNYMVRRHKVVKVQGLDLQGNVIHLKGQRECAAALQHEVDHLEGKLICDIAETTYGTYFVRGNA